MIVFADCEISTLDVSKSPMTADVIVPLSPKFTKILSISRDVSKVQNERKRMNLE
jgi:hypothetical protein